MAEREFLGDRRRTQEEEYFQKQEQQLIAGLQRRTREEAALRALTESTGILDQDILQELAALGYTPDTVAVLHLVPLIQVAWAEGGISEAEKALIIQAARARGIEPDSSADRQLASWFVERPSAEFFERTLNTIGKILRARPPEMREDGQRDVASYALDIALASGGILGIGKVSREEQRVLDRIREELKRAHAR